MLFYKYVLRVFQEKTRHKKKLLKASLLFTSFCFLLSFLSFCLFASGLKEDGSHNLAHLLILDKIRMTETARLFFSYLHGLPLLSWLYSFPSSPLFLITKTYSFSLIFILLISFLFCFLILPKEKKEFIFFPLLSYLTGAFVLLDISVSVAFSVCSYIWVVAFIIHYADLSKLNHKVIFLIAPLPLLLSHEMMSDLSCFLIFLCLYKLRDSKTPSFEIFFVICFFIFLLALKTFLLFKTTDPMNFNKFQKNLFFFEFLWDDSQINLCLLTAFLLKLCLILKLFKQKTLYKQSQILLVLFSGFNFFLILFLPFSIFEEFFWTNDYAGRVYPPVISLPFCLFAWFLAEIKSIKLQTLSNTFLGSFCLLSLSFTVYRLKSDLDFYDYRKEFSAQFENCEGVVSLSSFKKSFTKLKTNSSWKITAESLILPQKRSIKAILFNDLCEKDCEKSSFQNLFMNCHSYCESLNFRVNSSFDNFNNSSYFNFQPLLSNIKLGRNFCANLRK